MKTGQARPWQYIACLLGIITLLEVVNLLTGRWLSQFAIVPRNLEHLAYIFTAPLLHANLPHYLSNIVSMAVLSFLLIQFGTRRYVIVTLLIVISTGLLVWLFARDARHIGASGVIYGYFGYLLLAGFVSKRFWLALISVLVAFFYGGMIWGVLPSQPYISWESHLFGFISGLFIAYYFRKLPIR